MGREDVQRQRRQHDRPQRSGPDRQRRQRQRPRGASGAAASYNWSASKNSNNDVGIDRYIELGGLLGIPPLIVGPGTASADGNNYFKIGKEGCR